MPALALLSCLTTQLLLLLLALFKQTKKPALKVKVITYFDYTLQKDTIEIVSEKVK